MLKSSSSRKLLGSPTKRRMRVLKASSPSKTPKRLRRAAQVQLENPTDSFGDGDGDDMKFLAEPSKSEPPNKRIRVKRGSEKEGGGGGAGLLEGLRPRDVSARELVRITSQAKEARDLFGNISASETIEKIFEFFGKPSIDIPWFFQRGSMMERTIIPSEHNRELQDILVSVKTVVSCKITVHSC